MSKDIHVAEVENGVLIYDRFGGGHITIPYEQTAYVADALDHIEDDN